ncbi:MAG: transcriptional regulator, partial [Hyphomicrobiales bacterium]|nr:transcriptional regulator [Hyphomicrobiales bacterium]
EHIIVLAGPISFLLSSDSFQSVLEEMLRESIPADLPNRERALADVATILEILRQRKETYRKRKPAIVNLMSALEIERLLRNGFTGKTLIPEEDQQRRRMLARAEVEYFARLIEEDPIGIQIGLVTDKLPQTGFQIFRQPDRKILSISPFRLGEHPNVRVGVAMITSAPEALTLHEKAVKDMWSTALKGHAASAYLRNLLAVTDTQPKPVRRISSI